MRELFKNNYMFVKLIFIRGRALAFVKLFVKHRASDSNSINRFIVIIRNLYAHFLCAFSWVGWAAVASSFSFICDEMHGKSENECDKRERKMRGYNKTGFLHVLNGKQQLRACFWCHIESFRINAILFTHVDWFYIPALYLICVSYIMQVNAMLVVFYLK